MKKICLLLLILSVFLSSCASGQTSASKETERNRTQEGNGYKIIYSDSLPVAFSYNDVPVELSRVDVYEMESDYSYMLYVVIGIDVSKLEDKALHWFTHGDLDTTMTVSNPDQDKRTVVFDLLGKEIQNRSLYLVYTTNAIQTFRHSFSGSELAIKLTATQETKHTFSGREANDFETVNYSCTLGENLPSPESIEHPLYDSIIKWLKAK